MLSIRSFESLPPLPQSYVGSSRASSCVPDTAVVDVQVAVDMEYHRTMFELHRQVNSKEVIVGWYATGNEISEYSVLIHDFYSRQCDLPVHLCLDTEVRT